MAHQAELMRDRIAILEKTIQETTKRKSRKRKRVQEGGTLTYSTGSALVFEKNGTVRESIERSSGKARADRV